MLIDLENVTQPVLQDQVAVITGAGQGIGKETARILAHLGTCVVIAELNETGLDTEKLIQAEGGRALFIQTDIADPASVARMRDYVHKKFGPVALLINNAEAYLAKPLLEHSVTQWDRVFAVNLRGAFLCVKAFLPDMLERHQGVIVTMESADGMPYLSAYSASKVGLRSLAISLAGEVGDQSGVSVFCFGPGIVDTPGGHAAFRELAPMYHLTEEQFIQQSGVPFISAELAATGLVGTLIYAREFHGQETSYVAGLTKLSLSPRGEPVTSVPVMKPESIAPQSHRTREARSSIEQAVALNRKLEDILRANVNEYGNLPMFVRPVIKRMFHQGTGMKVEDWLAHAHEMTRRFETHTFDAGTIADYCTQVARLAEFITKQQTDARSWIKDPQQLEKALDALRERQTTAKELGRVLGEIEAVKQPEG